MLISLENHHPFLPSFSCKIVIAIETVATAWSCHRRLIYDFGFPSVCSKEMILENIGISVLETPCRSDKLFSANTQIYFPAHRIIAYIPLFSSLRKGLRNPVFMRLSRLKCAFFIHHFAHFYFLQLIILRVNLIRTNEMWSFSEHFRSDDKWT